LKLLLVGYGSIGKRHIKNLSKFSNLEIIVCTSQKTDSLLKKYCSFVSNNIDDCILQHPDAAIIANESYLHIKYSLKLAKNGIHLFIEKPLATSMKNVKKLLQITNRKKLITLMGCHLRFHPCISEIKNCLDNEELGKILSVQIQNGSYLPDWHPYEDYSTSYASSEQKSGGIALSCIHEIDYMYWFFGKINGIISLSRKVSDLKISTNDLSSTIISFKKNFLAEIHLDFFQKPSNRYCKIIGSKSSLYWNANSNNLKKYDLKTGKWNTIIKIPNFKLNQIYLDELTYFLNCVKENKKTFNDLKTGIAVLEIGLGINKAAKKEKMVKI
jgi:predicted dehydrogenase